MNSIEIPKTINQIIAVFNKFGMWGNDHETVFREVSRKVLYLVFYICFVISVASGAYITDDEDECIFLTVVAMGIAVMLVRMWYILWKKKEIFEFIQVVGVHSIQDHEAFIRIKNKLKMFIKFVSFFTIMIFVTLTMITVSSLPVVSSVKRLPFNIGFILDWKNSVIGYWMAFAFVVYGIMLSFVCVLLTILIWYLMLNFSIKYEVLGCQFRNIGVITDKKTPVQKRKILEAKTQNLFLEELIGLIKAHQNIKEIIVRFRSCFTNLFFVQIATSAMEICGSIYALVFSLDTSLIQYGIYVGVLVYNLFDILIVMYLGNEINLSSNRLSYCLFESNWTEQTQSCKKCIIILTEALKQPDELVIGKLYPMNLETFTSILNLAYSMFNILQNIK